jgi:SulP family sulfate permease
MNQPSASPPKNAPVKPPARAAAVHRWLPDWLRAYPRADLGSDLLAGLIVSLMLVPQAMAYALLAGLPPQVGLYASILPPVLYGLFGSSRVLAVGPVALVSLLVASGLQSLAPAGSGEYLVLALTMALLAGLLQIAMGAARLGRLVSFISHPVISGFTSAAALMIAFSQVSHLLGLRIASQERLPELLSALLASLSQTNPITLAIGLSSLAVLYFFRSRLEGLLRRLGASANLALFISKSGPLLVVLASSLLVWLMRLDQSAGVQVVGAIPSGLPRLALPSFDLQTWRALAAPALTISLVGFLESISVARSLASRRRQKVNPDQELVALGIANLGAAFTGGYPVTGGLSRSMVNFSAGAKSGLASIVSAGLVALAALFLTPLFAFLPRAALAAIIVIAVASLLDFSAVPRTWRYNKADAIALLAAFVGVLGWGAESGILAGVAISLGLYLWRTSRPHIAIVGRLGESEHFRNILRHQVHTWPNILAVRVDESLYFANTQYLESALLNAIAEYPRVEHLLLICSAINFIDASALETLENLAQELAAAGVALHLAEVKGPVMDRLERSGFVARLGRERVHLSTHIAVSKLAAWQGSHG